MPEDTETGGQNPVSRRNFLKGVALATAAAGVAVGFKRGEKNIRRVSENIPVEQSFYLSQAYVKI